jgi:hypothetical protein
MQKGERQTVDKDKSKENGPLPPTFLLCGAAKCGTTSLYSYISDHPDVYVSTTKETKFFTDPDYFSRGIEWYRQFYEEYDGESAVGEGDTGIMYYPGSAERVHKINPDVRLLFVLRDPVEQVFSHYWFGIERGLYECSTRTFSEFIRDHENRWTKRTLDVAKYHEQLVRFDPYFDDAQKKVILFRELTQQTEKTLRGVYRFIGVDERYQPDDLKPKNVTTYPNSPSLYRMISEVWRPVRSRIPQPIIEKTTKMRGHAKRLFFSSDEEKPSMDEKDRRYLQEYYREHNRRLESYLDRDLSHWT